MKSQDFKKLGFPDTPGVYIWKHGSTILYIGRATNLRDRVGSYFARDLIISRGPHILDMVTMSDHIEYLATGSVLEAIILEANLIKKHHPKYNTKEKDNKSFVEVIITDEDWPRVLMVRSRDLQILELTGRISRVKFSGKIKYRFGPFPSGTILRESLKIIRKIFPFRDDRSTNPDTEQFYIQLGLTPDVGNSINRKNYLATIGYIRNMLSGKTVTLVKQLTRTMHACAKRLEFEQAAVIKKQLFALEHINDIALIKHDDTDTGTHRYRIESYDVAHISGSSTVGVMTVVSGGLVDKTEYKKFIIRGLKKGSVDDYASLSELLSRRFNHPEWIMPSLVVVDGGIGHYNTAVSVLKNLNISIPIVSVIKDNRHKPKAFHGRADLIKKYKKQILLANSESHRFAIGFHKQKRAQEFLGTRSKSKTKTP